MKRERPVPLVTYDLRRADPAEKGAVLLACVFAGFQLAWVAYNGDFRQFDVENHLSQALDARSVLREVWGGEHGATERMRTTLGLMNVTASHFTNWPRLAAVLSAVLTVFAGDPLRAVVATNVVWVGVLVAGVFMLARRLSPSWLAPKTSLVAVAMLMGMPSILGAARLYGLDFPLACVMPMGVALLLSTDGFSRRRESVVFGVVSGVFLLVKGQYLLYIAPIAVMTLWQPPTTWRERLVNAGLSGFLATAIASVWFHGREGHLVYQLLAHLLRDVAPASSAMSRFVFNEEAGSQGLTVGRLTFYLRAMVAAAGPAACLAMAVALVTSAATMEREMTRERRAMRRVVWGVFFAMVVMTAASFRAHRLAWPMVTVLAVVCAARLVDAVQKRSAEIDGHVSYLVGVLVVAALMQGYVLTGAPVRSAACHSYSLSVLGGEAGDFWARPPRAGVFDSPETGGESRVLKLLREAGVLGVERARSYGFVALPQVAPLRRDTVSLMRLEAARLMGVLGAVERNRPRDGIDVGLLGGVSRVETVDALGEPDWFAAGRRIEEADVIVAAVFSDDAEAPTIEAGEGAHEAYRATTLEAFHERLGGSFALRARDGVTLLGGGQVVLGAFVREGAAAAAFSVVP